MKRYVKSTALLLAAALCFSGCSGGDAENEQGRSPNTPSTSTVAAPPAEIEADLMTLKEVQAEVAASGKVVVLDMWATW